MAYSQVGIVNMGLQMLGVDEIVSLDEDSKAAISANASWEYLRDEVLEAKNWRFATKRLALAQNTTSPVSGYDYAYTLPAAFLRIVSDKEDDPVVYPVGAYGSKRIYIAYGAIVINNLRFGYKIELLSDDTKVLVTDYDNSSEDLYIRYVSKDVNIGNWTAHFCNTLATRIAWHLAYKLTESTAKRKEMREEYLEMLRMAGALNVASDWVEDETGNDDWETAGR